ncbi:MAG: bifunctional glutamate N-acetyltransferase/amino-acid acetyltransferase ArgJ [Verrucomicrobiota bacterium]
MEAKFKEIGGGVTAPKGYEASSVVCGIKDSRSQKKDLALVYSEVPAVAAGAFTVNRIKAAPVIVSAAHLRGREVRAIIANSGNANACTGPHGILDAKAMTNTVSAELGVKPNQVLVCSTGIIGVPMPMERILPRIPDLIKQRSARGSKGAAEAIMTSDTRSKSVALKMKLGGKEVRLGAIAKGAGMICPNMATMLCFVTTDAVIDRSELKKATLEAVGESFNRISVDGDMSTNDSVVVLANGAAKNKLIENGSKSARKFRTALSWLMLKLAKMIVKDGERVTKFVVVKVFGARTFADARKVAESVANSTLVKCSWNGNDPNWGRIIDAIGYSGADVQEDMVDIGFNGMTACSHGMAADTPVKQLERAVSKESFSVSINLNLGNADYTAYTSDLSPEYVDFNRAEYAVSRLR